MARPRRWELKELKNKTNEELIELLDHFLDYKPQSVYGDLAQCNIRKIEFTLNHREKQWSEGKWLIGLGISVILASLSLFWQWWEFTHGQ